MRRERKGREEVCFSLPHLHKNRKKGETKEIKRKGRSNFLTYIRKEKEERRQEVRREVFLAYRSEEKERIKKERKRGSSFLHV